VYHNGDAWECKECAVTWNSAGSGAEFEDDFGDLKESVARWTHIQRLYDRRFPTL
jgi:hypothetical protein